jgi:hypothetical protein
MRYETKTKLAYAAIGIVFVKLAFDAWLSAISSSNSDESTGQIVHVSSTTWGSMYVTSLQSEMHHWSIIVGTAGVALLLLARALGWKLGRKAPQ